MRACARDEYRHAASESSSGVGIRSVADGTRRWSTSSKPLVSVAVGHERYQCGIFVDAEPVGVQAKIVLEIMFDDHLHMVREDLESMKFLLCAVVDDAVADLEVSP